MTKNEKKGKWKTLRFEEMGADVPNLDLEGLVGIEELHDYGIVSTKTNNRKKNKKRKAEAAKDAKNAKNQPEPKKAKISTVSQVTHEGGFKVESIESIESSNATNTDEPTKQKTKKKNNKSNKNKSSAEKLASVEKRLPMEQMSAWSSFGVPEPVLRGLADQGFERPTLIQELSLPAAMHGRRDILGAAETGSGKTLAFGVPIIKGILELKEKILRGEEEAPLPIVKKIIRDDKEPKIINMNKMSKKELQKLKNKSKKSRTKTAAPEEESDDNEDDEDLSDPDKSDISDDESEAENDGSETDNESEIDDVEKDESEVEDEESDTAEVDEKDESEVEDEESDVSEVDENDESEVEELSENEDNHEEKEDDNDEQPIEDEEEAVTSMAWAEKPLFALVLTPTRELAIQVKNHLVAAAKHTDLRIAVVVGGMAQVKQERILLKCPEIVVATPGRLWEMIQQGNEHLLKVSDIRFLAIDETDRMIERGHFEELHHLLDKINENEHKRLRRQNFVFSATLTMVHDLPSHLKTKKVSKKGKLINRKVTKLTQEQKLEKVIEMLGITNPKVVDITKKNQGSSNTLTECRIMCPITQKDYYLYYVLKRHPGRTIVFCNSIGCVKRLTQLFNLLQCNPMPLHASMQQRQRLKNLDRFRDHPCSLLVSTDVAARGLDIPDVEHVIHYQVPRTAENYVHRSGRTARANKEGITILIMEPGEVNSYSKICKTLSKTEDLPHFPILNAFLTATKQRVDLARDLDQAEFRMKKTNTEIGWYEKSMKEMDIILDEGEKPRKVEKDVSAAQKSKLNGMKKQLNRLLSAPLFPKGFSFKYPTGDELDENFGFGAPQNALEAMKSAIQSGTVKKVPRKDEFVPLAQQLNEYENIKSKSVETKESFKKVSKNKWKKIKRK